MEKGHVFNGGNQEEVAEDKENCDTDHEKPISSTYDSSKGGSILISPLGLQNNRSSNNNSSSSENKLDSTLSAKQNLRDDMPVITNNKNISKQSVNNRIVPLDLRELEKDKFAKICEKSPSKIGCENNTIFRNCNYRNDRNIVKLRTTHAVNSDRENEIERLADLFEHSSSSRSRVEKNFIDDCSVSHASIPYSFRRGIHHHYPLVGDQRYDVELNLPKPQDNSGVSCVRNHEPESSIRHNSSIDTRVSCFLIVLLFLEHCFSFSHSIIMYEVRVK